MSTIRIILRKNIKQNSKSVLYHMMLKKVVARHSNGNNLKIFLSIVQHCKIFFIFHENILQTTG